MFDLNELAKRIEEFKGQALKKRLDHLQTAFSNKGIDDIHKLYGQEGIDNSLFNSAILVKNASSQIDEIVHSVGILLLLPKILDKGEVIEELSLGAGNTGKNFDLTTNKRIAEFKFIHWKGGPESIRQNSLFKDFFYLAESPEKKDRYLYVIGMKHPMDFLRGGRDISSVLKDKKISNDYRKLYGNQFKVVREYYAYREKRVKIRDINEIMPSLARSLNEPV